MAAAPGSEEKPRPSLPGRRALLFAIIALVLVARALHSQEWFDPGKIRAFIDESPLATAGAFVLLYAVCVISLIPTLPLNLAAGFFWGWFAGGMLATLGVTLGAVTAFACARFALGPASIARVVARFPFDLGKIMDRLDWRAVAFLRLNPAVPTSIVNYALGITPLRFSTYCWSTSVFLLPATFAIALAGERTESLIVGGTAAELMGALTAILAIAAIFMAVAWVMRPAGSAPRHD